MNKIYYILLTILIISCGINLKNRKIEDSNNIKVLTNIYEVNQDSLLIKIIVSFPISNLVFIKKDDKFHASIETIIRVEENNSEIQIHRISKSKEIIENDYNKTRSGYLHQLNYEIILKKNDYKLITSIKDLDSFNTWDTYNNIKYDKNNYLFSYYNIDNMKKYIINKLPEDIDTVWLEIPKYNFQENNYKYIISQNDNILDTNIIDYYTSNNFFVDCPILINKNLSEDIDIIIKSNSGKNFSSFISLQKSSSLWSNDMNEILGVMSYILPYSKIKKIYNLSEKEQKEYIVDYLTSRDPEPDTKVNEYLQIIKIRYEYVNKNYSDYNIGWRTDRGKVYIINGPPDSMDLFFDNQKMINYEKWYYIDKEFIFSDERSLGEMQLMNNF